MHIRMTSRLLAGTALVLAGGLTATAALAQDSGNFSDNEIIVTAQKREQSVQDVPIAVSALGEQMIQANRVTNSLGLTGLAPGLVARVNPGGNASPSFSMRGVSASASVPTQDRQIPIYLDGVYLGGNRGSISDVADLERIEVLRGPQGTLFGRNATAGAVQFITRQPTGKLGFIQELTVGNLDQFRSRTTIDLPQTGPLSAYVTYVHDERRGDVRNLGAGKIWDRTNPFNDFGISKSPKWLGGRNSESIGAVVRFDNGGSLTASYRFDWFTATGSENRVAVVLNPNSFVGGLLSAAVALQPAGGGRYGPVTLNPSDRRPKAINDAWSVPTSQKVQGHNFTVEFEASDSLTFKNILSYRKSKSFGPVTISGLEGLEYTAALKAFYTAPQTFLGGASYAQALGAVNGGDLPVGSYFASYGGNSRGDFWQVSEELQGIYTADRLTVTAGAMYYYSKANDGALEGFTNNFAFMPVPDLLSLGRIYEDYGTVKSIAAYIQGEYQLTDQLGIVAGGRITKEDKFSRMTTGGAFVGDRYTEGTIVGATVKGEGRFKKTKPTFSVGLNYEPNNDILLYAKYSTAFLSGGATGDITFAPETAKSWEAGIKSDWLGGKLRLNLTGYYVDYTNSQAALSGSAIGRPDLGVAVIDLGDVKVKGLELDFAAYPVDGLSLGGTLGYTDDSLRNANPVFAQGRPTRRTTTPLWVGSGFVQYVTAPISGDATLTFRTDATYQSKSRNFAYTDLATRAPVFAPYEFTPTKVIVNGRIALKGIEFDGADVEIAAWAKNLFDNKMSLYSFDFGQNMLSGNYEQARTFGLDLIFKFNR
jgi:iron complex outermembrane recepter protein